MSMGSRRHGLFQVAFTTGILVVLMWTDRNGNGFVRIAVGVASAAACAYAAFHLWRGDKRTPS